MSSTKRPVLIIFSFDSPPPPLLYSPTFSPFRGEEDSFPFFLHPSPLVRGPLAAGHSPPGGRGPPTWAGPPPVSGAAPIPSFRATQCPPSSPAGKRLAPF